uniref:Uncharacterized protein n=1 Tax=Chromera velia CCMP2878 TaxID=1169474 RepID=A0A0G4GT66_9ALVE|eukprot:Cvel_5172.t1-p1 / transcript=Cvel_5172.t1 / gene=Cvel_5172 / organism=Chromera_velia_CCMP2878 / gene_product=hypothetical protein / transcript_product=hypothetical protein / location=Cvel_scaffold237:64249-64947(-) / protein_length=233 / sequence_SO=supercontig / SO=protein_coding / is_pseudo=false
MDRQIRCLPSGGSCKTATRGMECSLATDERPRAVFWYESGSSDPSEGICAASEQHDRRRLLPVERCEDIPLYAELQGFGMSEEAMASRCNKFAIFTGFEVVKGSEADEDPPQKRVVAIPCALSPGARRWRSASVSPLSFCSPASPVKECRLAVRGSCSAFVELRRCAWSLHNDTTAGGQSEEGGQASGCEWRECKEPSGRIEPKIRSASCETGPLINNLDTTGAQILPVRETM